MVFLNAFSHIRQDIVRIRHLIVNAYLVGTPDRWVMIDTGMAGSHHLIRRVAKRVFGKHAAPRAIILTHGHFDHAGGVAALVEDWDVPLFAHRNELPFLTGKQSYAPADPLIGKGIMPLTSILYRREPYDFGARVQALPDDGTVPFLDDWQSIATPGHTPGHVSFFRERDRSLIAGDAFTTTRQESLLSVLTQHRSVQGPPGHFTPDWSNAEQSLHTLAGLKPELAATGHGMPMSGEKLTRQLQSLDENFVRCAVPKRGRYARLYRHQRVTPTAQAGAWGEVKLR